MTPAPPHLARVVGLLAPLALGLLLARSAAAHIDLIQPPPREVGSSREPNSDLKQGPCGQVATGRTSRVSVFEPGETIEVTWTETINHRSYYRVAFDRDGDDAFPTFAGTGRGAQGIDPRDLCPVDGQVILAYELEDGQRSTQTLRVTLPDVECERCTLQVVQYMFDANNPYYFQCADVALRRREPADAGAVNDPLDASLPDAADDGEPRAAPTCSARIAPLDAGRSGPRQDGDGEIDEAAAPPPPSGPAEDEGSGAATAGESPVAAPVARRSSGCAVATSRARSRASVWVLLAAAAVSWRLRRNAPEGSRRGRSRRG